MPPASWLGRARRLRSWFQVCLLSEDLHEAGLWKQEDSARAPLDWSLDRLIHTAIKREWLPVSSEPLSSQQPIDQLLGEVGNAMRFVQYARNLVAHPGKQVYELPWMESLGRDEYTIV